MLEVRPTRALSSRIGATQRSTYAVRMLLASSTQRRGGCGSGCRAGQPRGAARRALRAGDPAGRPVDGEGVGGVRPRRARLPMVVAERRPDEVDLVFPRLAEQVVCIDIPLSWLPSSSAPGS